LEDIGINQKSDSQHTALIYSHVFAALVFYGVLCGCYVIFAPLIAPWLKSSTTLIGWLQQTELLVWLRQIVWPNNADELLISMAQRTLSFVVPLAIGMYLFSQRRQRHHNESLAQAFLFVASLQFMFALLTNVAFSAIMVAQQPVDDLSSWPIAFFTAKNWTDVLLYSITPCAALLSWIVSGNLGIGKVGTIFIIMLAAAIAFCGSQFLYDTVAAHVNGSTYRNYCCHQLVLGAFITMSYGLAALIANDVLPLDPAASRSRQDRATSLAFQG
jgi:hypothetical protein